MANVNRSLIKTCSPESEASYNSHITFEEIEASYRNQTPICGIVISADPEKEECTIALNDLITATLPFKECTVQDFIEMTFTNQNGEKFLSNYTKSLIGKKVMVTITKVLDDYIEVSRKPSLERAFKEIYTECSNNKNATFLCSVLSHSSKAVFVDIGGGIVGFIHISNLSFTEYYDLNKWITIGEKFYAKIQDFWEDGHFSLSRKAYYLSFYSPSNYKRGEYLTVKISRSVSSKDGYFVELPHGMVGIMDSAVKHEEGDVCTAVVRKVIEDEKLRCGFRIHLSELH